MAETTPFDTHRFVKNLTANGFTEAQAEVLAEEQVHLLNSNLVTKADLEKLRGDLEVKLGTLKGDLEVKLGNVKGDLEVKLGTVQADLEVKLGKVKADLEVKLGNVQADLEVKIETVKADILKWMVTALIAQTGLIVALIRLL